jgi:hypothetical protein
VTESERAALVQNSRLNAQNIRVPECFGPEDPATPSERTARPVSPGKGILAAVAWRILTFGPVWIGFGAVFCGFSRCCRRNLTLNSMKRIADPKFHGKLQKPCILARRGPGAASPG